MSVPSNVWTDDDEFLDATPIKEEEPWDEDYELDEEDDDDRDIELDFA